MARQARMYEQSRQFFERYDYFVLPVTQVSPFDVNTPYPTSVAGTPMATYIDWMRSCWYITFMANPAMSVPAGFTPAGLPVGCRSSAATATNGACSRSRTRSSRRPGTGPDVRLCESHDQFGHWFFLKPGAWSPEPLTVAS